LDKLKSPFNQRSKGDYVLLRHKFSDTLRRINNTPHPRGLSVFQHRQVFRLSSDTRFRLPSFPVASETANLLYGGGTAQDFHLFPY